LYSHTHENLIPEEPKVALERAAKDDDRSVFSVVERIRRSWLVEHNYLEKAEASPAALWKVEARKHKVQIAFRQLVQQL